ncbi:MAG: UDP-N-acetylmuramoyl-L-alanyl-D-glutamate--2,6-diaminopimelate ligase, partial [Firmicutes bacterium]|nr:UDP-N-acetylmuramoyl-L-alanyl-D-glutamate--2,6-diaminopimelate ligase [Bacillota bacterium]
MNLRELKVSSLAYDSKSVTEGSAFFAIEGYQNDGNDFIDEAIENGAKFVVTSRPKELVDAGHKDVTIIEVEDVRKALAISSCEFYNNPSEELQVIGVTGTKGKTSVTFMIKNILETAGIKTGIIGTVYCGYEGNYRNSSVTTPQSLDIQKMMRQMLDSGCKALVMEVSSQGLMQSRVEGIEFNIGVFTNVSPDHIGDGEHKDFEEYLGWKSHLFDLCKRAVVNGDDRHWRDAIQKNRHKNIITFGRGDNNDICYRTKEISTQNGFLNTTFEVRGKKPFCDNTTKSLEIPLPGEFNVENALAAISTARALGVPWDI